MKRRTTPAQQAILSLLKSSDSAMSQDMLEQQLQGTADRVTIYRVLNRFSEDGITHRIVSEEGKSYFALCKGCEKHHHAHDHFHFRCLACQRVECLPEQVRVALPPGYQVAQVNCWVSGYCAGCKA
ncbi:Fur family transcriptional regulator [Rufibacter quisquiliarum]|uniref:Fur family ferric uptake transcriptional regulator n=1 Tax=Rufibacter quisquiliarum TaxID=1549639 RepID=A0A839GNM2_9BACT|nr:transcriptional repressor [Rufibacter quisquiliarum]MBA9076517.1 Fur family ferric uptake transcriptional regulator [Rufibacter quisquiliarum]